MRLASMTVAMAVTLKIQAATSKAQLVVLLVVVLVVLVVRVLSAAAELFQEESVVGGMDGKNVGESEGLASLLLLLLVVVAIVVGPSSALGGELGSGENRIVGIVVGIVWDGNNVVVLVVGDMLVLRIMVISVGDGVVMEGEEEWDDGTTEGGTDEGGGGEGRAPGRQTVLPNTVAVGHGWQASDSTVCRPSGANEKTGQAMASQPYGLGSKPFMTRPSHKAGGIVPVNRALRSLKFCNNFLYKLLSFLSSPKQSGMLPVKGLPKRSNPCKLGKLQILESKVPVNWLDWTKTRFNFGMKDQSLGKCPVN
jgi:hypothetical protein